MSKRRIDPAALAEKLTLLAEHCGKLSKLRTLQRAAETIASAASERMAISPAAAQPVNPGEFVQIVRSRVYLGEAAERATAQPVNPGTFTRDRDRPFEAAIAADGRPTRQELNATARKALKEQPTLSLRELANILGSPVTTVQRLPAWLAVANARRQGRKPRAVRLTEQNGEQATTKLADDQRRAEIGKLIREQARDDRQRRVSPGL